MSMQRRTNGQTLAHNSHFDVARVAHDEVSLVACLFFVCRFNLVACDAVDDKATAELLVAAQLAINERKVAEARVHALNTASHKPQNSSLRAVLRDALPRASEVAVGEIAFETAIALRGGAAESHPDEVRPLGNLQ